MAANTVVTWRIRRSRTGQVRCNVRTKTRGKSEKSSARRERWLKTEMRRHTPVKTGVLRKGWRTSRPTSLSYQALNQVRYAAAVDVNGRSAGYVTRGLRAFRARVRRGR